MAGLGTVIQSFREERGWTQGQLATYAGLSPSYLSQIESGQREAVAAEILARIARRLGVSSEELLERAGLLPLQGPKEREADELVERAVALGRSDETVRELLRLLPQLPPAQRQMLLALGHFSRQYEAGPGHSTSAGE